MSIAAQRGPATSVQLGVDDFGSQRLAPVWRRGDTRGGQKTSLSMSPSLSSSCSPSTTTRDIHRDITSSLKRGIRTVKVFLIEVRVFDRWGGRAGCHRMSMSQWRVDIPKIAKMSALWRKGGLDLSHWRHYQRKKRLQLRDWCGLECQWCKYQWCWMNGRDVMGLVAQRVHKPLMSGFFHSWFSPIPSKINHEPLRPLKAF